MVDHIRNRDTVEVVDLTAREDGRKYLVFFRCGEDENNVGWWFLKCFEECVECTGTEHVHLIDDEHAVFSICREYLYLLHQEADVIHTVV